MTDTTYIFPAEAAELIGTSVKVVRRLARDGILRSVVAEDSRPGPNRPYYHKTQILVSSDDVKRYAATRREGRAVTKDDR